MSFNIGNFLSMISVHMILDIKRKILEDISHKSRLEHMDVFEYPRHPHTKLHTSPRTLKMYMEIITVLIIVILTPGDEHSNISLILVFYVTLFLVYRLAFHRQFLVKVMYESVSLNADVPKRLHYDFGCIVTFKWYTVYCWHSIQKRTGKALSSSLWPFLSSVGKQSVDRYQRTRRDYLRD
jgi:hypothetical protein